MYWPTYRNNVDVLCCTCGLLAIHCVLTHLQENSGCLLVHTWFTVPSIACWPTYRENVYVRWCARGLLRPLLCFDTLSGRLWLFLAVHVAHKPLHCVLTYLTEVRWWSLVYTWLTNLVIVHFITQVHVITSALSLYIKKEYNSFSKRAKTAFFFSLCLFVVCIVLVW